MPMRRSKAAAGMVLAAVTAAVALIAAGGLSYALAADIHVLCSNGFQPVMLELQPKYERATNNKIVVRYGLSTVLGKEIEDGESFDLAILAPPQIDGLINTNKIAAATRTVLARSGIGVMVRAGAPKPDIATLDAFKRTLLAAKSIGYAPQGQSGIYLVGLFGRLGL